MNPVPLLLAATTVAAGPTLDLDQVLATTAARHPALQAARATLDAASGERRAARGAFDLKLKADAGTSPVGPYRQLGGGLGVEQPTRIWGAKVGGGYRYGSDFPAYKGGLVTPTAGEAWVGVSVPLLRDRAIDEARFGLRQGETGVAVARAELADTGRTLLLAAGDAWVSWVAAGARLRVAQAQATLAEARARALQGQVATGAVAALKVTDNQRTLLARRAKVVDAQRKLAESALKLGVFVRDTKGRMAAPTPRQLPPQLIPPAPPKKGDLNRAVAAILKRRPDIQAMQQKVDLARQKLALLDQRMLPRLDLQVEANQGVGQGQEWLPGQRAKPGPEVMAKVKFSLPVQRRKADGKRLAAQAKLRAAEAKLRLTIDKATAAVRAAHVAWRAAADRHALTVSALKAAEAVAVGERRKLELGRSDLLRVQLREQYVVKAAFDEIDAAEAWHRARLRFLAESGELTAPAKR